MSICRPVLCPNQSHALHNLIHHSDNSSSLLLAIVNNYASTRENR